MCVVLPVPDRLAGVVGKQAPCIRRHVAHGDVQHAALSACRRAVVTVCAQCIGYARGQAAVVHTYVASALVIQSLVYNAQAFRASVHHAPAHGSVHLVLTWHASVYLVDAALLEKQGVSLKGNRAGKFPVRTQGHGITVRGQAHVTPPVFEVTQLAGVNLVDGLPVHKAVLAAP